MSERPCAVIAANRMRRHLKLSIDGVIAEVHAPFGLIPPSSQLFTLVQEADRLSDLSRAERV